MSEQAASHSSAASTHTREKSNVRKSLAQSNRDGSLAAKVLRASGMMVGDLGAKSFYHENDSETPGTLTTSGAVLGIISTILGGGMVGIPWAIYS